MRIKLARRVIGIMFVCLALCASGMAPDEKASQEPHVAAPAVPLVEFDQLGLPEYIEASLKELRVPDPVKQLAGRRVQFRVFPRPTDEAGPVGYLSGVPEIASKSRSRSPAQSCSGPLPLRFQYYFIPVLLREGQTIEWQSRHNHFPLLVEGILHIQGEAIDIEYDGCGFYLEDATYREVEPREDYERLWFMIGC